MSEREQLRRKLSAILMDTSEENPMECEIIIDEDISCGLSTLEMPEVRKVYQLPTEGIIYFQIYGEAEPTEFDDMRTANLRVILKELKNQIEEG